MCIATAILVAFFVLMYSIDIDQTHRLTQVDNAKLQRQLEQADVAFAKLVAQLNRMDEEIQAQASKSVDMGSSIAVATSTVHISTMFPVGSSSHTFSRDDLTGVQAYCDGEHAKLTLTYDQTIGDDSRTYNVIMPCGRDAAVRFEKGCFDKSTPLSLANTCKSTFPTTFNWVPCGQKITVSPIPTYAFGAPYEYPLYHHNDYAEQRLRRN
jgi:hypothetical protein